MDSNLVALLRKLSEVFWDAGAYQICNGTHEGAAIGDALHDVGRRLDEILEPYE